MRVTELFSDELRPIFTAIAPLDKRSEPWEVAVSITEFRPRHKAEPMVVDVTAIEATIPESNEIAARAFGLFPLLVAA